MLNATTTPFLGRNAQHEADGGETKEHESCYVEVLPVLGQPPAAVEPSDRSLDDPALGQRDEAFRLVGSFDDLDHDPRQDFGQRIGEDRPLIGAVGEQFFEIGEPAKQRRQQQNAAVAVLNLGGMNDGLHQQPLGVDENMTLLALDLLSCIEPVRIDRGPPFSALLTLWLSMMAAVGLASRSACSRHFS